MKEINQYIQEKLIVNNTIKGYNYFPKDKYELRKILEERLAEDKNVDFNDIDVSKIIDMGHKGFPNNTGLFEDLDPHNIDISNWNVSNVKDMSAIFFGCKHIKCDISKWDVSNVENMNSMFAVSNFNGDISEWDVKNVRNMRAMFYCSSFTGENGDISNWNISNVKYMRNMFFNCPLEKNPPKWYKE